MTSNGLSSDSNIPIDEIDRDSNNEFIDDVDHVYDSPVLRENHSQSTKTETATEDNSKNKQIDDNKTMLESKNTPQNDDNQNQKKNNSNKTVNIDYNKNINNTYISNYNLSKKSNLPPDEGQVNKYLGNEEEKLDETIFNMETNENNEINAEIINNRSIKPSTCDQTNKSNIYRFKIIKYDI